MSFGITNEGIESHFNINRTVGEIRYRVDKMQEAIKDAEKVLHNLKSIEQAVATLKDKMIGLNRELGFLEEGIGNDQETDKDDKL